jgi:hypothetical protein
MVQERVGEGKKTVFMGGKSEKPKAFYTHASRKGCNNNPS